MGVGLAAVVGMVGGCSDDEANGAAPAVDGGTFCPATIAAALDSKTSCIGDIECPLNYKCGPFDQQASCRCTNGKFTCVTGRQEAIDNPASPPCTSQGTGSDKQCPATQNGTDGTSCSTPGLQCFYQGFTCPESPDIPKVDNCQCVSRNGADGGATLQYRCEIEYCNPKSDASIPIPPPVDSGGG